MVLAWFCLLARKVLSAVQNCYFQTQKKRLPCSNLSCSNRQLPILPGRLQPSTFGVYVLNYCVRYGYRWVHIAIITGSPRIYPGNYTETYFRHLFSKLSPRPISTGPLRPLPDFHSQPIYLVVFKGSYQIAL